jgi:heme/copper-type cytochrome/quinol oxidase subunit 3
MSAVTATEQAAPAVPARATGAVPATTPEPAEPESRTGGPGPVSLAALLFVAAEAMVLAGMLAAYFALKGGTPTWPPRGVNLGTYLPTVVTITAAMTAFSAHWGLFSIRRNDQRNAVIAFALTVLLGLALANAQWYSLTRAGFGPSRHAYGTLYYTLIGYHLVHVAIGLVVLVVIGARLLAGHFDKDRHDPVRAAAIVWQYGNVAWSAILTALFLVTRHS